MPVEFGFNIPQGKHVDWDTLRDFALTAERVGIDHLWTEDHLIAISNDSAPPEAWTIVSMLAGATDRIRLGHHVLCMSFRNPALLAKMTATLDHFSSGRFIFAIGAGWFPIEYEQYNYPFPGIGQRLQELRETIEICKLMWTEPEATYVGRFHAVHGATCAPKPAQQPHPPILIGGAGEKVMLRIVAEHADIWNNFQTYINQLEQKLDVLKRHCDDVGRDFGDITIAQQVPLFLGADEAAAARRLDVAKRAAYLDDPEATGIWGHPQRVIDEIGRHVDRGIRLFNFSNEYTVTTDDLELFAAEVLPAFR